VTVASVGLSAGLLLTSALLGSAAVGAQRTRLQAAVASSTPGDFNGDGHPDLLARTPAGSLYLYRGNGTGGFLGGGTVIGTGWNMFNLVTGIG